MAKKTAPKKPAPKKAAPKSKPAAKSTPSPKAKAPAAKPAPAPVAKPAAPEPKKAAPAPVAVKTSGSIQALTVNAQGSGGNAAQGNTHPANILAVVSHSGVPIADLQQSNFTVMEHFTVPGQQYPFSNNIVGFKNLGSGAYGIQVKPINNAPWSSGHHLAQIIVSTRSHQGMTAVKIIVR
ncbi:MAG: hypothetical protein K1X78_08225 [Verrucomicrobiaceae bacterium]|nr:hypothetical protein [Verrucomicrobiaceae bacterium]